MNATKLSEVVARADQDTEHDHTSDNADASQIVPFPAPKQSPDAVPPESHNNSGFETFLDGAGI